MSNYMFEAQPRAVQSGTRTRTVGKAKYRDPNDTLPLPRANIHFDKRVVRGNTYAAQVADATVLQAAAVAAAASRTQRVNKVPPRPVDSAARRRLLGQQSALPVAGRTHMLVQTDEYLEELVDQVFESERASQTDPLDDAAAPVIFMAKPLGEEAATQVEPGELFDFEMAVEPLLEVICGKALEQSLVEVLEEEEIAKLQRQREHFEHERNQILAETQRLEAASQRHHAEKQRRMAQERERVAREAELAKKAAARTAAKQFMAGLQSSVVQSLVDAGHLYDPVLKQVDASFMPWLLQAAAARLARVQAARDETDALITAAVQAARKEVDDKREREEEARRAEERRLAEEAASRARAAEEAKRAALEAEAARLEREAAEAAEALRNEREDDEDAEDREDDDDQQQRDDDEDEDEE